MENLDYKEDLLNRLERFSEQIIEITMRIQIAMIDKDIEKLNHLIKFGEEIQAEMEVLMLIHSALYENELN